MRRGLLTIAMALLPVLAGTARADITLFNETDVPVSFTVTPWAPPDQMVMAVICGQYEVAARSSGSVPANSSCGQRASVGANGAANPEGWSAYCRSEGVSWTDGRVTVTGTGRALICDP